MGDLGSGGAERGGGWDSDAEVGSKEPHILSQGWPCLRAEGHSAGRQRQPGAQAVHTLRVMDLFLQPALLRVSCSQSSKALRSDLPQGLCPCKSPDPLGSRAQG